MPERGIDDAGAYIAPPANGEADAWTRSAAAAGQVGTQQLLEVTEVSAPAAVVAALALPDMARVVVRRRLIILDGRPVELADSYYPESLAAGTVLAEARKIRGGAPKALADLGRVAVYADEEVELDSTATADEAGLLEVPAGTRVVRTLRVLVDEQGPFDVETAVMLPAGRTLRHRIMVG